MRFTLVRVAIVCLGLLLVSACGSDTGEADETTTTAPAAPDTTVAEEAVTTSAPSDDPGGGTDGGGVTTMCLDATQAMAAAMSSYTTGLAGAMGGSLDDESLQLAAGQLEAMADAAPDEIKDDLEVIAEELGAFYTALSETGYETGVTPTPEQMAELSALAEVIDQEAFDEASANINAWFEANC
jgi:hypothetical protein